MRDEPDLPLRIKDMGIIHWVIILIVFALFFGFLSELRHLIWANALKG